MTQGRRRPVNVVHGGPGQFVRQHRQPRLEPRRQRALAMVGVDGEAAGHALLCQCRLAGAGREERRQLRNRRVHRLSPLVAHALVLRLELRHAREQPLLRANHASTGRPQPRRVRLGLLGAGEEGSRPARL